MSTAKQRGETFGERVRATREALGLSQRELAERLESDQSRVSQWELGQRMPDVERLPSIVRALGAKSLEFDCDGGRVRVTALRHA